MPAVAPAPSDTRIGVGRLAVVVTLLGWLAYFTRWLFLEVLSPQYASPRSKVEAGIYLLIMSLLTASALAYLVCRLGSMYRSREHRRVPRAVLDGFFTQVTAPLTVLVPSYKEEARVVRNTLLSAALQEYPDLRVVLLIDDPPHPAGARDQAILEQARALPGQIHQLLAEPHAYFAAALDAALATTGAPTGADLITLASHHAAAAGWLTALAAQIDVVDHGDSFLADQVINALATDFATTEQALRAAAADGGTLPRERLLEFCLRLERVFRAEVTSFERKQYACLSHEANKAMNLNSYIGLMGGRFRDLKTVGGRVLVPSPGGPADLEVLDPDYVLTLDADSILLPEYCIRLVYLLEQEEHARVGVAQTPYSAYPGAASRLERIAGASTDLQHIVHQGMTHYQATFWVGANAVLRKRALDEIRATTHLGNWEIHRYVQDGTVIEDTESTVDLRTHNWQLFNYPERLSYSATPADFGSLCIQRKRWANGGLLILPKLRRQRKALHAAGETVRMGEWALRLNYIASICWSSFSLLLLLAYPFRDSLVSPLLGLIALPYFMAMAADLRACGYRRLDVLRIYGFNLVLLPVNLAGVFSSLMQAITGGQRSFSRTPKVSSRTIPSLSFVFTPYLVVGLAATTVVRDYYGGRWNNLVYAAINTVLASYAIVTFIGVRYTVTDAWAYLEHFLYRPQASGRARAATAPGSDAEGVVDWAAVLEVPAAGTDGTDPPSGVSGLPLPAWRAIPVQRERGPASLPS
jgi:cellulose synthase/poly-beta-1,6-N-acetylglucosamine synthase-like glycosyltransferase